MDKILTIIIPAFDCEQTIGDLLNSIDKNIYKDIKIIFVNDNKNNIAAEKFCIDFCKKNNIYLECFKTEEDSLHCPGNTRQVGLEHVDTPWFTFIDNDDLFVEGSLTQVINILNKFITYPVIATNFYSWNKTKNCPIKKFEKSATDSWHHGKFYNTEWIKKLDIHFKKNLFSHEDLYFNNSILSKIIPLDKDYLYLPIFTYKWIDNPNSLSHSFFNGTYTYIEMYLRDYILSCSEPFILAYKDNPSYKNWYLHQVLMTLLYSYFYFCAEVVRLKIPNVHSLKENYLVDKNYFVIKEYLSKIKNIFDITAQEIIDYINNNPALYLKIKENSFFGSHPFVERISFEDFIHVLEEN